MPYNESFDADRDIKLSVIVLSYNQESTIAECLDSLLSSETKHIELIISDDGSKDSTVSSEQLWLTKNAGAFRHTVLLTSNINRGTVKNLIDAIKASNGKYIKCIGGDDFFTVHALDHITRFTEENLFDVAFSPIKQLDVASGECSLLPPADIDDFFTLSAEEQFRALLLKNRLRAPGAFFSRDFWEKLDLERQKLILVEDWYIWVKGLSCGCRYILCQPPLVVYRRTSNSVSRSALTLKIYLNDIQTTYSLICKLRPHWIPLSMKIKILYMRCIIYVVTSLPTPILRAVNSIKSRNSTN